MNWLDRAIAFVSPTRGLARMQARASLEQVETFAGQQGGYAAGQLTRLSRNLRSLASENRVPRDQLARLRERSWDAYRNNPHAKKAVRSLLSKVLPLMPQSQAVRQGEAFEEFTQRAAELWTAAQTRLDWRGAPHQGGQTWREMSRTALRCCFMDGDLLFLLRSVAPGDGAQEVPVRVQLIKGNRLDEQLLREEAEHPVYRGIELDADGRRVAYWIRDVDPATGYEGDPKRYAASRIGHLYVADDVDQLRGTPWAAASLAKLVDTGEYEYNELIASKYGACPVMGVKMPTGANRFGVNVSTSGDLVDSDGNPITGVAPGMIINLGENGALEAWNSMRPNSGAEGWIQHLLRSIGVGIPGTKSSTLTGDYRKSSFSAERSADNDTWPEIEDVQDWFASGFCQPIWEAFVTSAVLAGRFEGIVTASYFAAHREELLLCDWQGPVPGSINPTDDAAAATARVAIGISSVPRECRAMGIDWRSNLAEQAEFLAEAKAAGVPTDAALQSATIAKTEQESQTDDEDEEADETVEAEA